MNAERIIALSHVGAQCPIQVEVVLETGSTNADLLARRREVLDALAATLPHPERHRVYALDVTDHAALARAAHDFIAAHDGADVVIAAAGISHGTLTERPEDLPLFDAVFAASDLLAMGAIRALTEHGLRVPDEVSVIGYDDAPGAASFVPPLTSVHQYLRDGGVLLARKMLGLIHGDTVESEMLPTTLIVRQT